MRIYLLAFIVLNSLVARGQDVTPAAPNRTDAGIVVDGLVYPTNFDTIDTPKAGILGLRAIDIPRYTQTGPLPDPAPAQHWVLPPVPHNPKLPTIWTIGDSTVRCGVNGTGDDRPNQWGWGAPFVGYFDANKVNVVNRAVGGTTTASFYNTLWSNMVDLIKPGDVVIMQFGTNSGRGELPGIGEETQETAGRGGQPVVSHTYGWYLRKFIAEIRAKGATPVVCSLIPRGPRSPNGAPAQATWARDVAVAARVGFIDLHELITRKYDAMERSEVAALFAGSPHTNWTGAVLNAETVISGLKALWRDPVASYYLPQVSKIAPTSLRPRLGTRRMPVSDNPRDRLPFTNSRPDNVNPELPTLFIAGDSTATTGNFLTRGWGALLVDYFDTSKVNLVNMAVGGARFNSYQGTWDRLIAAVKPGDYVVIEFGHNSGPLPGIGDETQEVAGRGGVTQTVHTHGWYLRQYIADVRAKGAIPIASTITPRKKWSDGKVERLKEIVVGQGGMSDWTRQVAAAEHALLVDHTNIIADIYDKMGEEEVAKFFTATPTEYLHTNTAGAVVNAEAFIAGLKAIPNMPLVSYLNDKGKAIAAYKPASAQATATRAPAAGPFARAANARPRGANVAASTNPRDQLPFSNANIANINPDLPTLFICGDSTATTGNPQHRGWGAMLIDYFDTSKLNLVNYSQGGINFPNYYTSRWPQVVEALKPGDFVVVELGHNGGHLNGTGDETGASRWPGAGEVHTFGWYFRTMIHDARAKGATPIVSTTTTRYLWTNPNAVFNGNDGSLISKNENYDPADDRVERGMGAVMADGRRTMLVWAEQVAKEEGAPFVDHSNITADLYEKRGREVVGKYHSDRTHTYTEGAAVNAETFIAGLKALPNMPLVNLLNERGKAIPAYEPAGNNSSQTTPGASQNQFAVRNARGPAAVAPSNSTTLNPNLPTLFVVGDSTASNGPRAGWGDPLSDYFDPTKVNVANRAKGARSSRSFQLEGSWDAVLKEMKPGDYVLIQMGQNDGQPLTMSPGRSSLPGTGEETQEVTMRNGQKDTVHTFGWYIRKYVNDAKAKGATPIVMSLTAKNLWLADGKNRRPYDNYPQWSKEVAQAENVQFLDHINIMGDIFEKIGQAETAKYFRDSTHTTEAGAALNAAGVVAGLKALNSPLANYLSEKGKAVKAYEPGNPGVPQAALAMASSQRAPSRGLPGMQNARPQSVCPRDLEPFTAEDFSAIKPDLPTLIIAGDSTANKGSDAWHRGWAAVVVDYFDTDKINVVNRARGGRSSRSFVREGLWDELVAAIKPGDVVMLQFGHNDGGDINNPNGRADLPGIGDETQTVERRDGTSEVVHTFGWYNRKFIQDIRAKGGTPVVMGQTPYNRWRDGRFVYDGGKMAEWAKQVADQENVLFLNHGAIIAARYDQLGQETVQQPFFPADHLHTSTLGAIVNAKMFVAGVKALDIKPLVDGLNDKGKAIPAYKDGTER